MSASCTAGIGSITIFRTGEHQCSIFRVYFHNPNTFSRNIPKLLSVLGDADGTLSKSYTVSTKDELSILLDDPSFAAAEKMQLVELIMEKHDAPRALKAQADLSGKANKYAETLETRG